jgi:hypothetical protein
MEAFELPVFHIPFASEINPDEQIVHESTQEWLRISGFTNCQDTMRRLECGDFGNLAALCYPDAAAMELELSLCWINWLFLLDDQIDESDLGRQRARAHMVIQGMVDLLTSAPLHREPVTPLEIAWGTFWTRAALGMSESAQQRFPNTVSDYLDSLLQEIDNRVDGYVPDLLEYADLRRDTSAMRTTMTLNEFVHHITLPCAFSESRLFRALSNITCDVVAMTNHIFSFDKESALGGPSSGSRS